MRNPYLPKLFRAIAASEEGKDKEIIYEQAAIELEKLEKIYGLNDAEDTVEATIIKLNEILNEEPNG